MDTADLKTNKTHVNSQTVFSGTNKLTLVIWFNLFIEELSPKRYWLGPEIPGGGGRGRQYLMLYCHHQNDSFNYLREEGDCT